MPLIDRRANISEIMVPHVVRRREFSSNYKPKPWASGMPVAQVGTTEIPIERVGKTEIPTKQDVYLVAVIAPGYALYGHGKLRKLRPSV